MKKVLIVDDNEVMLETLLYGFKKYHTHFQPVFAKNGLEAMEVLDREQIALVVTDIQMPMVDGLVLLAFIRERYPDIPCMVMTSYLDDALKELIKKDVLHFFEKPVYVNNLAQAIISELTREEETAIDRIAIRDLLNHIVVNRKTAVFKLISDEGQAGYFYFYKGDLFSAVCGKVKGEDAVQKILTFETAKVVFLKPPDRKGEKNVSIDPNKLIQLTKTSRLSVEIERSKKRVSTVHREPGAQTG